jgi:hypothetical protein
MSNQSAYSYTNTAEYRQVFRSICKMNDAIYYSDETVNVYMSGNGQDETIDAETLDEYHYDEAAVSRFLDTVSRHTKDVPAFQRLYVAAAALMISEDVEVGMSILCSYDYLCLFYSCYRQYVESINAKADDGMIFDNMTEYAQLLHRLQK